jgi:hypothetical protein
MNPLRTGDVARAEAAMDMDQYYRQLEQVHGSLHQFGSAEGLRVNATNGAAGIKVMPGVALDSTGRHISLAAGGQAEVGPQADAPGQAPTLVSVDAVNGATVPTTGMSGDKLVVIRHWETFDSNAWNLFGAYVFMHTPWIRIVPTGGYVDTGNEVILARVTLDPQGKVTNLQPGPRHGVGIPTETIRLRRGHQAAPSPNFGVDDVAYGEIRPRPNGGVQITAVNASDTIELQRDNGSSVASIELAAEQTNFRRSDGLETVRVITSQANIEIGNRGVEGDLLVFDASRRLTVALDGADALGTFGAEGVDGAIRVKSRTFQNAIELLGATGDVWFRGRLRDYNGSHPGITHAMLKDLTDGGETSLHKHNLVNGSSGTRVGIRSGFVELHNIDGQNAFGDCTINFSSGSVSSSNGTGFKNAGIGGPLGNFSGSPHAVVAPTQLYLSTYDDTAFAFQISGLSTSSISFVWSIDSAGHWPSHLFNFLIVGPVA